MNENIDLIKILKNCPKGTKLYSTIFGEVKFVECNNLYQIVVDKEDKYYHFTSQGMFIFERIKYNLGECCLFPSKDQRDWSKFSAPWYKKEKFNPMTLQPFDRVIARSTLNSKWRCTFFSHLIDDERCILKCITSDYSYPFCIPYNDETKYLAGTTEEAPDYYRYWKD